MDAKTYDIAVIGGGIVGVASALKMQRAYPEKKIALIEKEGLLAPHQTGNNSGVIHSGIYYPPGSKKAKTCVDGRRELVEFAKKNNVAHDICGKVVVASNKNEIPFLEKIQANGEANGVEDVQRVTPEEIKEIEPFVEGIDGLRVGCTGIIDFRGATNKMAEEMVGINSESDILLNTEVQAFGKEGDTNLIKTNAGVIKCDKMVLCGGLWADKLALSQGVKLKEKVVGFRGDYYELTEKGHHKVKHLIYPVPDPAFPFLGVHFTRMTNGEIECGPNAVFTFKREGYGKTDFSLKDTADALSYSGTWSLFLKNMSYGINEYRRAFSKKLFLRTLQKLIPSLEMDDIKPGRAGVRALLLNAKGDTRDDFRIEYHEDAIHVLNAPSPAATASLAIGGQVADMAKEYFGW